MDGGRLRCRSTRPSAERRGRSGRRARSTPLRGRGGADQPDRRRLAGARPAGDDREPGGERRADCLPLLRRRGRGPVRGAARAPQGAGFASDRSAHLLAPAPPRARRSAAGSPDRLRAVDLEHQLAGVRHLAQQRRGGGGPPSTAPAFTASSATGRQVDPSLSASASTCSDARARARRRVGAATPPARAIRSAVWNPTPNTLVSSYGRSRTTRCARRRSASRSAAPATPARAGRAADAARGWSAGAFHDRTASLVRVGLSPTARNAPCGSRSIASSTSLAVALEQPRGAPAADVLDALEVRSERGVAGRPDAARPSATLTCIPNRGSSCQTPSMRTRSRSSRCAIVPMSTTSSPSRSASTTAKPVSSFAHRRRRIRTSPSNGAPANRPISSDRCPRPPPTCDHASAS